MSLKQSNTERRNNETAGHNIQKELVAPCGINCAVCGGYLAWKHDVKNRGVRMSYCTGCRPRNKKCAFLKKRCELLLDGKVEFCYQCPDFPCERLQHIDQRYRRNFRTSLIDNLEQIKKDGMQEFLKAQEAKWRCPNCGETVCCHNGICLACGIDKLRNKKQLYRWEE